MRLLLTGGGTLGSVTPLLALHDALHPEVVFWIGTKHGVEEELIHAASIPYYAIVSGKLRRYWDVRTLSAPFAVCVGFLQALFLLIRLHPTQVFSAGGYVAVPVVWAACVLRIPTYAIQLYVQSGLANRIIAHFDRCIFTVFQESANYFKKRPVQVVGSFVRQSFIQAVSNTQHNDRPTFLIIGGGTGAEGLNALVRDALVPLVKICNVVHLTGRGKHRAFALPHYQAYEFLSDELPSLMALADIVITRAGMGTLSELAYLKKAAIVIPLPESPQVANAGVLARAGAVMVRSQEEYTPTQCLADIQTLLDHPEQRKQLGDRLHDILPTDGARKIAALL
ncbi:MAG: glycosyltransferase [Candidatus Yonathbacteria bacterium]|nr:glycosyltransferase [Candidatus Yonathbacteria bacterium]